MKFEMSLADAAVIYMNVYTTYSCVCLTHGSLNPLKTFQIEQQSKNTKYILFVCWDLDVVLHWLELNVGIRIFSLICESKTRKNGPENLSHSSSTKNRKKKSEQRIGILILVLVWINYVDLLLVDDSFAWTEWNWEKKYDEK